MQQKTIYNMYVLLYICSSFERMEKNPTNIGVSAYWKIQKVAFTVYCFIVELYACLFPQYTELYVEKCRKEIQKFDQFVKCWGMAAMSEKDNKSIKWFYVA